MIWPYDCIYMYEIGGGYCLDRVLYGLNSSKLIDINWKCLILMKKQIFSNVSSSINLLFLKNDTYKRQLTWLLHENTCQKSFLRIVQSELQSLEFFLFALDFKTYNSFRTRTILLQCRVEGRRGLGVSNQIHRRVSLF